MYGLQIQPAQINDSIKKGILYANAPPIGNHLREKANILDLF